MATKAQAQTAQAYKAHQQTQIKKAQRWAGII